MTPAATPTPQHPHADEPVFVAAGYALEGDLRFLSHHDELRMIARSLVRADWPLAYSGGFNPQPRLTLPLPRSVGMASTAQWALAAIHGRCDLQELHTSLAGVLPPGVRMGRLLGPLPCRKLHPRVVTYAAHLTQETAQRVAARLYDTLSRDTIPVQRCFGPSKPPRQVDIRPSIIDAQLCEQSLILRLGFDRQQTARPAEVLQALAGNIEPRELQITRTEVLWAEALDAVPAWPTDGQGTAKHGTSRKENDRQTCGQQA